MKLISWLAKIFQTQKKWKLLAFLFVYLFILLISFLDALIEMKNSGTDYWIDWSPRGPSPTVISQIYNGK